ncbi:MAG: DUF4931 domain-containing protein [Myxococcota bacterium]
MTELRRDPVVDRWVLIAGERAKRPSDFDLVHGERRNAVCSFCPGNESLTPPEVAAVRPDGSAADTPGWTVRVVPNKFPAVSGETGTHEVIIETAEHTASPADLGAEKLRAILGMWRARLRALRDAGLPYRILFKNQGVAAGATREHLHSQIIGLRVVPARLREELAAARAYRARTSRCIWCDALAAELADGRRIVEDAGAFVLLAPYASRQPFELAIVPRVHAPALEDAPGDIDAALAATLASAFSRLRAAVDDPPFNLMVHGAPDFEGEYHFRCEIVPTLTKLAGFEIASGCHINPTPPEQAAKVLREAAR